MFQPTSQLVPTKPRLLEQVSAGFSWLLWQELLEVLELKEPLATAVTC